MHYVRYMYLPNEGQEVEVVRDPQDGALVEVDQLEVLLGVEAQEGSHDKVLVLWGVVDP